MPYSVLILDDDVDFNSLLTDIFEQANYIVTSLTDPLEAVEVFQDTQYDLVVTDHKMPEMTGVEFMKRIKKIRPQVPVIMVSGYLENDTIRELISEGIGGVFLKPLNIFSLLERTIELIEEAKKLENTPQGEDGMLEVESDMDAKLGFAFRSFPCKTGISTAFAERLYSLRNFKSTLSLIGEKGMHYRSICDDIRGFYESDAEHFVYLSNGSFDRAQVLSLIEEAKKQGAERITCVLLELEKMSKEQKKLAAALPKRDGDFSEVDLPLRTIFCVNGDLDSLFDEGLIDENLYILMGTAEVRVPPLRECSVDVGVMAQQLVVEVVREKGLNEIPRFEKSSRDLFRQHKWEGNYEELRRTIRKIMDSDPGDVLALSVVKSVMQVTKAASPRALFESYLSSHQVDLVRAAAVLFGGERPKVASFYATDTNAVAAKMQ
ncbi:MAG: response regulator [Verrucomicrobiota bacterium]